LRKNGIPKPTVFNADGLLNNIPAHLRASKGARSLKMVYATKEEKQLLKLHMAEEKIKKATEDRVRLQAAIDQETER